MGLFVHTAMGLALALLFVVRMFGRIVRTFLATAMIAVTAVVDLAASHFAAHGEPGGGSGPSSSGDRRARARTRPGTRLVRDGGRACRLPSRRPTAG
jgi:hypothetical protein